MYDFKDYFNPKDEEVPYKAASEELDDYLRLLDMVLEGYLEHKRLDSDEKLFSRGLVITESEMERYFSTPPHLRDRDVCDPALAENVRKAWDYIENRVARTLGYSDSDFFGDGLYGLEDVPADQPDDLEDISADEPAADAENTAEILNGWSDTEGADKVPSVQNDEEQLLRTGENENEVSSVRDDEEETEEDDIGLWDRIPNGLSEDGFEVGILWVDSLKNVFALNRTGVMAVILALAAETDRRYERIFGYLQDDISRTRPTVGLLNALMARITPREGEDDLPVGLLQEELFTSLFVSNEEDKGLNTELIINPLLKRIMNGQMDDEMQLPEALTIYREDADIPLFFEKSREALEDILSDLRYRFCFIENSDEDTVLHLLYKYALYLNIPMYVLDLNRLLQLAQREQSACLADLSLRLHLGNGLLAVRFDTEENEEHGSRRVSAARRFRMLERLSRINGYACIALFGGKEEPGELIVKSVPFLSVPDPDMRMRTEIWSYFLNDEDGIAPAEDVVIEDLADCYDISYSMIRNTVSHAKAAAGTRGLDRVSRAMILDSLRQLNQVDFSGLASYVRASYTWEDITISDDQRAVLRIACDRYRLRNRVGHGWGLTRKNAYGNGVSLLLYGPPGTGKTMAAQVVARELGIPLYRVDISRIFSKYIGETEKNLSVIFDAARGSNVILFFDEADALFSKRTEIGSSNDKYANSETAFLLQKIEEYDGMSILATNLYNNFDTAFVRRITYAVRLDSPDEEARYILWNTMLPDTAKVDEDIPFHFLAKKFELSGANIKAILFGAAYMAGAEGKPVGIEHIVRSMEYEYRKLGRFIDREAFGPYAKYLSTPGRHVVSGEMSRDFDEFSY